MTGAAVVRGSCEIILSCEIIHVLLCSCVNYYLFFHTLRMGSYDAPRDGQHGLQYVFESSTDCNEHPKFDNIRVHALPVKMRSPGQVSGVDDQG